MHPGIGRTTHARPGAAAALAALVQTPDRGGVCRPTGPGAGIREGGARTCRRSGCRRIRRRAGSRGAMGPGGCNPEAGCIVGVRNNTRPEIGNTRCARMNRACLVTASATARPELAATVGSALPSGLNAAGERTRCLQQLPATGAGTTAFRSGSGPVARFLTRSRRRTPDHPTRRRCSCRPSSWPRRAWPRGRGPGTTMRCHSRTA